MKYFVICGMALLVLSSCNQSTKTAVVQRPVKVAESEIIFSADSAYKYVSDQTDFGPRVPGSESHARCLEYFRKTFDRMGIRYEIQEGEGKAYNGKMLPIKNVIAKINPEKANRVLVCSHWDSRPFADHDKDAKYHNSPIDGANDGASGVGVIMEMARQMSVRKPDIGVDIIFFDSEDYGTPDHVKIEPYPQDSWCLGSQYWGKSEMGMDSQARYGILLDMVGASGAMFYQEGFSKSIAQSVVDKVWKAGRTLGYGNYFVNDAGGYITDDHYYVNEYAKVPCIDIIQYDPSSGSSFYEHWHTHNDTKEHIDKATLEAVGRTLLYVLYNE